MSGSEIQGKEADASFQPEHAVEEEPQQPDSFSDMSRSESRRAEASYQPDQTDEEIHPEFVSSGEPQSSAQPDAETSDEAVELWDAIEAENYARMEHFANLMSRQENKCRYKMLMTEVDDRGNNALQQILLLIEARSLRKREKFPILEQLLETILALKPGPEAILNKNKNGDTALSQVILGKEYPIDLLEKLMSSLDETERAAAIETTRDVCSPGCDKHMKFEHSRHCTSGYNLVKLAITTNSLDNIKYLITEVQRLTEAKRKEILSCKELQEEGAVSEGAVSEGAVSEGAVSEGAVSEGAVSEGAEKGVTLEDFANEQDIDDVPNASSIAAFHNNWSAIACLRECTSAGFFAKSIFSKNHRLTLALRWILKTQDSEALKDLLKDDIKIYLQKKLKETDWVSTFLHLKMSVDAIKHLYTLDVFKTEYLLPRPCKKKRLSHPQAYLCYNMFDYSADLALPSARLGANSMRKALEYLGWPTVKEDKEGWTFQKLLNKTEEFLLTNRSKDLASIFMLCVTTHGRGDKIMGHRGESGKEILGPINKLVDVVVRNTDKDMPKVVIIEACRTKDDKPTPVTLKDQNPNVLLLLASSFEQKGFAALYLTKLAEFLLRADGVTTLQEMHHKTRIALRDKQTAAKLGSERDIVLRNWKPPPKACFSCMGETEEGSTICCCCLKPICDFCLGEQLDARKVRGPNTPYYICKSCKSSIAQRFS